jgi:hypothetical protein
MRITILTAFAAWSCPFAGAQQHLPPAGIQWYSMWHSGVREAAQSHRPILLVSAAPHCAGVPGMW